MQPFPAEPAETTYTFHITPSTPEARERIVDGAEKPGLLRGTLAQGRDLARLLNSPIDLLDAGHTAFHINPDGRMPCEAESDRDEADLRTKLRVAMESLALGPTSIVGLVVDYRGWSMQLLAVNVEEDDAYGPYKWQATTTAEPVDDGPCDCVGRGMTCGSRRDPRWDDWARAVHKRSMARVLALKIERGE